MLAAGILLVPLLAFGLDAQPDRPASDAVPDALPPACPARFNDSLTTNGIASKNEPGTVPAMLKVAPEAEFSDQALKAIQKKHSKYFYAEGVLALVVDASGNPTDLCTYKTAGSGLDAEIAKAVRQYRFEPAKKEGHSVRFRTTVSVKFVLH
jgi:outer membrane biosynthesis protein TonB